MVARGTGQCRPAHYRLNLLPGAQLFQINLSARVINHRAQTGQLGIPDMQLAIKAAKTAAQPEIKACGCGILLQFSQGRNYIPMNQHGSLGLTSVKIGQMALGGTG